MIKNIEQQINSLRLKINKCDTQLLNILTKRYENSYRVFKIKTANNIAILDTNREESIINNLIKNKNDYLTDEAIKNIWSEILKYSKLNATRLIKK